MFAGIIYKFVYYKYKKLVAIVTSDLRYVSGSNNGENFHAHSKYFNTFIFIIFTWPCSSTIGFLKLLNGTYRGWIEESSRVVCGVEYARLVSDLTVDMNDDIHIWQVTWQLKLCFLLLDGGQYHWCHLEDVTSRIIKFHEKSPANSFSSDPS